MLVVDDEANIRELLCLYLRQAGFETIEADNGRMALAMARSEAPSLILLDLMLPERDGWEVCREIRASGDVPIIMLTARDAEAEKLLGFALGADDYVTKPFQPRELVARVRAVLRRSEVQGTSEHGRGEAGDRADSRGQRSPLPAEAGGDRVPQILDYGFFRLNRISRELEIRGKTVRCPAKEFDLLWLLAGHANRVFGREELLQRVWGYSYYGDLRTVDVHVRRLRQKIEPMPDKPRYIQTVWGIGYKFKTSPEEQGDKG